MQPNYLCKNTCRTCCCATNGTAQQLVFTSHSLSQAVLCGLAREELLPQSLEHTKPRAWALVRGPNIQQRQKLNTSCLPDYTSSAVIEGRWVFFKFKEEQIVRTERQKSIPLCNCYGKILVWASVEFDFVHLHLFAWCSCHWVCKSHQN